MTKYICKTAREEFNADHTSSCLPRVRTVNAVFGTLAEVEFLVTSVRRVGSLYPHIIPAPHSQSCGHTWNLLQAAGFQNSLSDNPGFFPPLFAFLLRTAQKSPHVPSDAAFPSTSCGFKTLPAPRRLFLCFLPLSSKAGWCLAPGSLPEGAAGFIHSAMRAVSGCPT